MIYSIDTYTQKCIRFNYYGFFLGGGREYNSKVDKTTNFKLGTSSLYKLLF